MGTVEFVGLARFKLRLNALKRGLTAIDKTRIGQIAADGLRSNFPGNPLGWKENAPATIKRKGSAAPLIDHGILQNAFYPRNVAGGVDVISPTAYGVFHEQPPQRPKPRKIPQRRFMVLRREVKLAILEYVRGRLAQMLKGGF